MGINAIINFYNISKTLAINIKQKIFTNPKFCINIMHQIWKKKDKVITVGWQQRRNSIGIWSIKHQIQYSPMYTSWILWALRQVKILNYRINFGNMLRQHLINIKTPNNQHPMLSWQFQEDQAYSTLLPIK